MRIAIIDDDVELNHNIKRKLERNGYEVESYFYFQEFIKNANEIFDLYVVDLWLKDGNGFEIIKYIRNILKFKTPILINSAYTDVDKKVYGLDLWADDYISKPMAPDEFLARIRANLRRVHMKKKVKVLKYKDYILQEEFKCIKNGQYSIPLQPKEVTILEVLIRNKKKLVEKDALIEQVWWNREAAHVSDNTINATLSKLRKKLEDHISIQTIVGKWYILE